MRRIMLALCAVIAAQGSVAADVLDRTLLGQPAPQPQPPPPPQPQPQPQQAPGPQPQPYPQPQQPQQPQPYPPQQPYPQQPQPTQQPYPQQPQPYPQQPQPYPPQQPYPGPYYGAPQPYPGPPPGPPPRRRYHDGEVIADFAAVGALASIDILVRQDVEDGAAGTFILLAGLAGGGAGGWLLTQKYDVDAGAAHSTTIGLLAGAANGALLIEPTGADDADEVMTLLFFGSAIGAGGGFIYGQAADLTSGQSIFVANTVLLGTATAALGAITGSRDNEFGNWENSTLALGLDGGLLAGALIAPSLDWSPRRAKVVMMATAVGALLGGALPGLLTKRDEGEDYNGDLVTGCMTAGLWAGFGIGILATRDSVPDAKYQKNHSIAPGTRPPSGAPSTTSYVPFVGDKGEMGVMAAGSW